MKKDDKKNPLFKSKTSFGFFQSFKRATASEAHAVLIFVSLDQAKDNKKLFTSLSSLVQ